MDAKPAAPKVEHGVTPTQVMASMSGLDFISWRGPELLTERSLREVDFLVTSIDREFPGFAKSPLYEDRDILAVRAMPQLEPSNRETCVSTAFFGRLAGSTAKPWFIEVISTLPVVLSFTG